MLNSYLKQFDGLLCELKYHHHNSTKLERQIAKSLAHLAPNIRGPVAFRIKCEIARLSKPSLRPVRVEQYLSDIDVFPFKHDGLVHHIESSTRHELLRQIKLYGNIYTVGVEEHLTEFIKKNADSIKHAQTLKHLKVTAINISEMIRRREERMYLGIKAEIILLPNNIDVSSPIGALIDNGRRRLAAVTQNLSGQGLRLRAQYNPSLGSLCLIRFTGLESEYVFQQPYVLYRCVGSVQIAASAKMPDGDWFRWSLNKVEHYEQGELTDFIQRQIQINRGRYRVDVDNVEQSVIQQSAEQFITNRDEGFTVFADKDKPIAGFGNLNGQKLFNKFSVRGGNALPGLILKDGLSSIPLGGSAFWVVLLQNDTIFSSILSAQSALTAKLLQQTVIREGGMIFQVSHAPIDSQFAFTTNCLPKDSNCGRKADRQRRLTDFYTKNTRTIVDSIKSALHFHPLDKGLLCGLMPVATLTEAEQKEMSRFCMTSPENRNFLFVIAKNREQRQEDRFKIDTTAEIEHAKNRLIGRVVDISESGCRIELSQSTNILKHQVIRVKFPQMASIGTLEPMGMYQVMEVSGTTLRLFADTKSRLPIREYMSHYLDRHFNDSYSTELGQERKSLVGLERALRTLHNSVRPNTAALLRFQQAVPRPTIINISCQNKDPLLPYNTSTHTESDYYKQWLCHWNMQNSLIKAIRSITPTNPYERRILVLVKIPGQDAIVHVDCFEKGRITPHKIKNLTLKLSKLGQVEWYFIDITRKSRVFDRYYREELAYLMEMAPHRGEELEKTIRSICGVLTVTPITELLSGANIIPVVNSERIIA